MEQAVGERAVVARGVRRNRGQTEVVVGAVRETLEIAAEARVGLGLLGDERGRARDRGRAPARRGRRPREQDEAERQPARDSARSIVDLGLVLHREQRVAQAVVDRVLLEQQASCRRCCSILGSEIVVLARISTRPSTQ